MLRLISLLCAAAAVWLFWPHVTAAIGQLLPNSADTTPRDVASASAVSLPEAPMPRDPRCYAGTSGYMKGFVTASTAETLTIRCEDGQPWVFDRGVWLGTKHPRHGFKYRFDQVHIGDEVRVGYDTTPDASVAQNLCIRRRPGGVMPVEPWSSPEERWPWHIAMQSQQDLEEKGLPEPCSPAWGEAPWIVDGVPVPADKLLASMRELDRRLKRTSNTVQPGTINGVAVPAELINKAMIEQGLIKPPPPPPKGIKN